MSKKRPLVFLGSSTEGLPVAKAIQAELQHSAECVIWSQGIFGLSEGTLESLVKKLETFDFAILVLSPDDLVSSRGDTQPAPRDNVLLELGMFIGGLGRDRTFIVVDRSARIKLPSDLAGITPGTYQPPEGGTMQSAVGPVCTAIDASIAKLGARNADLPIKIVGSYSVNVKQEKSINFTVTNEGGEPIPPYQLSLFHPKLGSYFIFPSEKIGPLLPDQNREHRCVVIQSGSVLDWFPRFTSDRDGNTLSEDDDKRFALRLVLEDSDKVLYENHRIALRLIKMLRKTVEHGSEIGGNGGGTWYDWAELNSSYSGE